MFKYLPFFEQLIYNYLNAANDSKNKIPWDSNQRQYLFEV